ncbi:rpsU-divergently transcribed protein, partial [Dimargaris cristalligena]
IYQAALQRVPEYGWSELAIAEAVQTLGYPPILHGIVPDGPVGLIQYFLTQSRLEMNRQLAADPQAMATPTTSARDRIRTACRIRLQLTEPYAHRWKEAAAILALPSNIPIATQHLYELSDDIWYYAGDRSADMSWYTKRTSLAGVYTATEMYMTEDTSPQFAATYEFLDRRLAD